MNKSPLHLSCKWYRYTKYELIGNIIQKASKDTIVYNPFDFFTPNMPYMQKGKNKATVGDLQIYPAFASIHSEKDALAWVNKYGMPYSQYIDKDGKICGKNFPTVITDHSLTMLDTISVDDICRNASVLRNTIALYNFIKAGSSKNVRNIVAKNTFKRNYDFLMSNSASDTSQAYTDYTLQELDELWNNTPAATSFDEDIELDPYWDEVANNPIAIGQAYLSSLIICTTQSVRETIVFESDAEQNLPKVGWEFSSLLALLYKMLLIDWTKGQSVRHCANKRCNNHFVPFDDKNIYCSETCSNLTKAQRHRTRVARQKLLQALYLVIKKRQAKK